MPRRNLNPIPTIWLLFVGREAVQAFLGESDYTSIVLTWEPLNGEISSSGDLGFTYGTYTLKAGDKQSRGTYVSVWKRDVVGRWKWVLDTGNPGLGPE